MVSYIVLGLVKFFRLFLISLFCEAGSSTCTNCELTALASWVQWLKHASPHLFFCSLKSLYFLCVKSPECVYVCVPCMWSVHRGQSVSSGTGVSDCRELACGRLVPFKSIMCSNPRPLPLSHPRFPREALATETLFQTTSWFSGLGEAAPCSECVLSLLGVLGLLPSVHNDL